MLDISNFTIGINSKDIPILILVDLGLGRIVDIFS